jgi:hypothetical protein
MNINTSNLISENSKIKPVIESDISTLGQRVQNSYKKSKETEDLKEPSRPMRRSHSLSQLDKLEKTESEECSSRSGALWECIGRNPSEFSYIYKFRIREEFDDLTPHPDRAGRETGADLKIAELYPAVEDKPSEFRYLSCKFDIEQHLELLIEPLIKEIVLSLLPSETASLKKKIRKNLSEDGLLKILQNGKFLQELGYQMLEKHGKTFLELPDLPTLLGRWHNLREKYPEKNLPPFDAVSSDGIADDLSYAEAYFAHDTLLSNGPEFCHDHQVHVISRIHRMLKGSDAYKKEKASGVKLIASVYKAIHIFRRVQPSQGKESWKKLCFIPGMLTDVLFSAARDRDIQGTFTERHVEDSIASVWEQPSWKGYIKKRFFEDMPTNASMKRVWNNVKNTEENFHRQLQLNLATK